ncbi:MAG TPA: response regulator [Pseudolabrys sp.]|jgi:CheY-like chemotaxis protein|nr:response regulator [Pseudolabrys sp.]
MIRNATPVSVLVVEDEVLISNLVADALSASGFLVHEVTTADEALEYIDSGAAIDVLFTDINLPGGMNGAELATRARQMRPEMPIVYASGRYKLSEIAPLVPRSLFMAKPYDPNDVCALLTRLTGAGSPSP